MAFVGSFEAVAKDTLFTQTYRQVACNIKESVNKICAAVILSLSIFDEAVMGAIATAYVDTQVAHDTMDSGDKM